ncbi:MAG TPA: universal stress protein [Streptosporangiaceae bacterium]
MRDDHVAGGGRMNAPGPGGTGATSASGPEGRTAPLVVGIDGGTPAVAAYLWAVGEAAVRRTGLLVVHAWEPPAGHAAPYAPAPARPPSWERAAAWLESWLSEHTPPGTGVPVRLMLERGDPAGVLPRLAAGAGLLVLGGQADRDVPVTFGPTIRACLSHARCPVVIVTPAPRMAAALSTAGPGGRP